MENVWLLAAVWVGLASVATNRLAGIIQRRFNAYANGYRTE
jgi:hypothetical protein